MGIVRQSLQDSAVPGGARVRAGECVPRLCGRSRERVAVYSRNEHAIAIRYKNSEVVDKVAIMSHLHLVGI